MGLPLRSWTSVVYNWRCGTLYVSQKRSHFRLAWSCLHRSVINWTHKCRPLFRATTNPCQISSRSVDIWENEGRKYLFWTFWPIIEGGHAHRVWLSTISRSACRARQNCTMRLVLSHNIPILCKLTLKYKCIYNTSFDIQCLRLRSTLFM